jgi:hypothetical protein
MERGQIQVLVSTDVGRMLHLQMFSEPLFSSYAADASQESKLDATLVGGAATSRMDTEQNLSEGPS